MSVRALKIRVSMVKLTGVGLARDGLLSTRLSSSTAAAAAAATLAEGVLGFVDEAGHDV